MNLAIVDCTKKNFPTVHETYLKMSVFCGITISNIKRCIEKKQAFRFYHAHFPPKFVITIYKNILKQLYVAPGIDHEELLGIGKSVK